MRKKWAVGIAVGAIAVAAVGAGTAASASTSAASPRIGGRTFTIYTHMIETHVLAPCPTCARPALPTGSALGAIWADDPVFSSPANTQQIGQDAEVISIVGSSGSVGLLNAAVNFTGGGLSGQLTAEGEINPLSSTGVIVITGGTGSFKNARGQVDYSGAGLTSTEDTLTVHLTSLPGPPGTGETQRRAAKRRAPSAMTRLAGRVLLRGGVNPTPGGWR